MNSSEIAVSIIVVLFAIGCAYLMIMTKKALNEVDKNKNKK